MTRRRLLSLLAGLPLVGRFVPTTTAAAAVEPAVFYVRAVNHAGEACGWKRIPAMRFNEFPIFMNAEGIWELRPIGPVKIGPFAPGSKRTRQA